jgi:hypothetical protein
MTTRQLEIFSSLLEAVAKFLRDVEARELDSELLRKAQDLHPIVERAN